MRFDTYFTQTQQVLVRRFATGASGPRVVSRRARLLAREDASFTLTFDPPLATPLFIPGDFLELHSDRFELGVRLTATCVSCTEKELRIDAHDDLELFYRRRYWRMDLSLWYGVKRRERDVPLAAFWEQALALRDEKNLDPSIHVDIRRDRLNLSAGGVRMQLAAPVTPREHCLLFLSLDDGKPTVCVVCEVVWVEEGASNESRLCGLRFCNLLEDDLKRIDQFVTRQCRFGADGDGAPYERSHSV